MTRDEIWCAVSMVVISVAVVLLGADFMTRWAEDINGASYVSGCKDAEATLRDSRRVRPPDYRPALIVTMTVRVRHSRTWRSYTVNAETVAEWQDVRSEALARLVDQIKAADIGLDEVEIEMGEPKREKKTTARYRSSRRAKLGAR